MWWLQDFLKQNRQVPSFLLSIIFRWLSCFLVFLSSRVLVTIHRPVKLIRDGQVRLHLVWSVISAILTFLFFSIIQVSPLLGVDLLIPATCFITGSLLISFYSALYFAKENFIVPNACSLAINIVLSLLFLAGPNTNISDRWLLIAYFAGFLLQGLLMALFYFSKKEKSKYQLPSQADLKLIIRYSSAAFLGNVIFFLVYRIDYWFVEAYSTKGELGNYIQVSKIVQWFLLLPMTISTAIFPLTASGRDREMAQKGGLFIKGDSVVILFCLYSTIDHRQLVFCMVIRQ